MSGHNTESAGAGMLCDARRVRINLEWVWGTQRCVVRGMMSQSKGYECLVHAAESEHLGLPMVSRDYFLFEWNGAVSVVITSPGLCIGTCSSP
jgi:hypothetical protein